MYLSCGSDYVDELTAWFYLISCEKHLWKKTIHINQWQMHFTAPCVRFKVHCRILNCDFISVFMCNDKPLCLFSLIWALLIFRGNGSSSHHWLFSVEVCIEMFAAAGSVHHRGIVPLTQHVCDTGPWLVWPSGTDWLGLLLGCRRVLVHQSPSVQYMTHTAPPLHPSPTSYREISYIS